MQVRIRRGVISRQAALQDQRSALQSVNVLDYLDILVCVVFLALSIYAKDTRRPALAVIFIAYAVNTIMAHALYLDSYTFYVSALIFDVAAGLLLMYIYSETKPLYIVHALILLVCMCLLNVIGAILYSVGDNGYFYVGAMFFANCALAIRLLISTRRDGDGAVRNSVLGVGWLTNNYKVPASSKGLES